MLRGIFLYNKLIRNIFAPKSIDNADNEEFRPVPRGVQQPNLVVVTERRDTNCLTCPDGQSCYVCLPCFHMVLCGACANGMLRVANEYDGGENPQFGQVNCPLCRRPVAKFKRILMPSTGSSNTGAPGEIIAVAPT